MQSKAAAVFSEAKFLFYPLHELSRIEEILLEKVSKAYVYFIVM